MIAPLAKFIDWSALQMAYVLAPLRHAPKPKWKLEEALEFLNGPDFFPATSDPARIEFDGPRNFKFPTPRPSEDKENNIVYGRLYRCAERWQERPVVVLLHGGMDFPNHRFLFPLIARRCNRAGFNAATMELPYHFQRHVRQLDGGIHLRLAELMAQGVAEIRALTGWFLGEGCPAVALWGNSYGGALSGIMASCDARLSAVILAAPGLDMNVFISTARRIVWPSLREQLLKQQAASEALNRTALNLTTLRPRIPKENILLIEAVHDLFVDRKSMELI